MSKVYNYMVLAVGLTFLMKFAGLPSGADGFISWLGLDTGIEGIGFGAFFIGVAALFTIGTGASLLIGYITKASSESFLIGSICGGIFAILVGTFVSMINYTIDMGWVYYVVYLMFVPLLAAFGIAMINYWRGSD